MTYPLSAPSTLDIQLFLSRILHSTPGKDGIPYEAMLQAGHEGVITLYNAMRWLCFGRLLDMSFSEAVQRFMPKKPLPTDIVEVCRKPFDLRPIDLSTPTITFLARTVTGNCVELHEKLLSC